MEDDQTNIGNDEGSSENDTIDRSINVKLYPSGIIKIPVDSNSVQLEAVVFKATLHETNEMSENRVPCSIDLATNVNQEEPENNSWTPKKPYIPRFPRDLPGSSRSHDGGPPTPPDEPDPKIKFKDCGGLEKQVKFLQAAILDPMKNKGSSDNSFARFGLEPPRGVLFYGPPGTGKTRLAQALGNELSQTFGRKVHFIYRKGQDIASKYFGESSKNLRNVFNEAKLMQPCVLFFDELDGLCPSRDTPFMGQANVTIVTTMLGLMDDVPKGRVFVIAATNRLEGVDPALRRPGRFDKYLEFLPPTKQGRMDILNIHTKSWKIPPTKEMVQFISDDTEAFTGADLAKLCRDAFDQALKRVLLSNENKAKNLPDVDLTNLFVTDADWRAAMLNMRPSNSVVFGSSLYTPPINSGNSISPLVQMEVQKITERILQKLPPHNDVDLIIRSLYVQTQCKSSVDTVNDSVISKVLTSEAIGKYSIFTISPHALLCTPLKNWPQKMDAAITQALGSVPSILFIPNVDDIWNITSRISVPMNLRGQLERLRGKPVLLLATGTTNVNNFTGEDPFKDMLSGTTEKTYEIVPPTEEQRLEYFTPLFTAILYDSQKKWSNDDVQLLASVCDKVLKCTENKNIGPITELYQLIQEALIQFTIEKTSPRNIINHLMQVVNSFITRVF